MAIDYHRHCQITVLSANGTGQQNGETWSYISDLTDDLENLPYNWISDFKDNKTCITQDFASILRIINTVAGDVKTNRDGINELNNGRDINLHIGDKTISFNTVKYSPVENLSIELPTVGIGLTQDNDVIDLKTASSDELGGIKVGDGLTIDEDGVLSANITQNYTLPTMSSSTIGGAKVGSGLVVNNGVLSLKTPGACSYVGISESGELIQSNTPPSGGEVTSTISTPVGTIIPWIGQINTPPDGYLLCNGSEVSKEEYADLYAVIGDKYGSGQAVSDGKFKLPNLTEQIYLQGSTQAGNIVDAGLPNIIGSFDIAEYYGSDDSSLDKPMINGMGVFKAIATSDYTEIEVNPQKQIQMVADHPYKPRRVQFSASSWKDGEHDSDSIYKDDYNKVTPYSMTVRYLICYKTFDRRKTQVTVSSSLNTIPDELKKEIATVSVDNESPKSIYTVPGFCGIGDKTRFSLFGNNIECGYGINTTYSNKPSSTSNTSGQYCIYYGIGQDKDLPQTFKKSSWDSSSIKNQYIGGATQLAINPIIVPENGFIRILSDGNNKDKEYGQVYVRFKTDENGWGTLYERDIGQSCARETALIPVCKGTQLIIYAFAHAGQLLPYAFTARFVSLTTSFEWGNGNTGGEVNPEEPEDSGNTGGGSGSGSDDDNTPTQPSISLTFDDLYPVGSVYLTTSTGIPSTFTGTWVKLSSSGITGVNAFKRTQ